MGTRRPVGPHYDASKAELLRHLRRSMRARSLASVAVAGLVASLVKLAVLDQARAEESTSVEGCILQRDPTSALVKTTDDTLVELDLQAVLDGPYALRPDSCLKFYGLSLGQGQNRVYRQAGWALRVYTVDNVDPHQIDKSQEVTDNDTSKASQTGSDN